MYLLPSEGNADIFYQKMPYTYKQHKIHVKNNQAISELPFSSVWKWVFIQKHSYENVFPLLVHFHANQTHFHMKDFEQGIALKKRHNSGNSEITYSAIVGRHMVRVK